MSDWLSFEQILGYIGSLILFCGYAIKSDIKTKTILIFSSIIFALHFFLLGALTAAAVCFINAMRNGSSIFFYKSKFVFLIFAGLYFSFSLVTYNTPIDILPATAAFLTCIGMFLIGGIKFRVLVVIAAALWIVHNIYVGSIGGSINSIVLFFISSATVMRLHTDRRKEQHE